MIKLELNNHYALIGARCWFVHPSWGRILLVELFLAKRVLNIYIGKFITDRRPGDQA